MDLIHKFPEEMGPKFTAMEGFDYGGVGGECFSSVLYDEDDKWEGEDDSSDEEGPLPAELQRVPEIREITQVIVARKTVLQPKAITVVAVNFLEG